MTRLLQAPAARTVAHDVPIGLPRLLAGWHETRSPATLHDHHERYGELPARTRDDAEWLVGELETSGLAGRGGAGFPTHRKLRAVADGPGRPVVVANGMEGEPASAKDRLLLTVAPHLVLDGAVLAALAVGARDVHLCIPRGRGSARATLERAVAERVRIAPDVRVRIRELPGRYVTGEETALVRWLNGGPALPTTTPPRPFERGVRGRPTLIQNVETLAHLALIARFGAVWFRREGVAGEPGSLLLSISREERRIAVLEAAAGTRIGAVASICALADEPAAVLVGGYFGSWLPFATAAALPLTQAALRATGGALGAGILAFLPAAACGLCETARVARFLAEQSAGQCGPCALGLPSVARDLALLCHGRDADARTRALHRMRQIEGRGACRHPDGAVRLVRSALDVFAEHVDRHERHGPCAGMHRTPILPVGRSGPEDVGR